MGKRLFTVRVIYKSGATMDFDCDDFTWKREGGSVKVTWRNAHPDPILIGADDIAAVYQLSPEKA
jgi:hypothetical protein